MKSIFNKLNLLSRLQIITIAILGTFIPLAIANTITVINKTNTNMIFDQASIFNMSTSNNTFTVPPNGHHTITGQLGSIYAGGSNWYVMYQVHPEGVVFKDPLSMTPSELTDLPYVSYTNLSSFAYKSTPWFNNYYEINSRDQTQADPGVHAYSITWVITSTLPRLN